MNVLLLCLLLGGGGNPDAREVAYPAAVEALSGADRVTGTVTDASGAPIVALVREGSASGPIVGRTDDRGRFSIERSRPSIDLFVVAAGFAPTRVPADAAGATRTIVLHPASIAEQVTVTAGRRELRGVDAPAAASVLTAGDLFSMAALAPDDALRFTPGFTLFRRSSSRAANPTTQGATVRGLSSSGASRTLVLADGVPLNDPFGGWVYWSRIPHAAIERVEIVRGGLSDLYGANAAGGVVHVVPADAGRTRGRFAIEGGNLATVRGSGFVSARRGGLGFAAAAERLETDGAPIIAAAERGPVDTPAGTEHSSWLARAGWRNGNGFALDVRAQGFDERRTNGTPLQDNDTNQRQISFNLSRPLFGGFWQATAFAQTQTYDQSFTAVAASRATETLVLRQRVPSEAGGGFTDWQRTFGNTTLVIGGDTREVTGIATETRFVAGRPQPPASAGGNQWTIAQYAQATVDVAPKVRVAGGARLDRWVSTTEATSVRRTVWHPSGRVSVTWQPDQAWSVRGSAYRAFRTPTLNELHRNFRVGDTLTLANDGLSAETLDGVEGSLLWAAGRWSWRATLFATSLDSAVTNVTLTTTPSLTTRQRQNAGSVGSRGLEAEGEWRASRRLAVAGNVTVTRARFGSGPAGLNGFDVPQVPRYQAALSLRFVEPAWLTGSLQLRAIGRQFEDDRNTLSLDRAVIVDAFAGRPLHRALHAFVSVENLFDATVEVGRTPITTVGLPRTARVGLRIFWR